jgi:hypothetical protein
MLASLRNRIARLERRRFEAAERAADEWTLPPLPPHTPEQDRMRAELGARLAAVPIPEGLSEWEAGCYVRQQLLLDEVWMELHYRYIESLYIEAGEPCEPSPSEGSSPTFNAASSTGPTGPADAGAG